MSLIFDAPPPTARPLGKGKVIYRLCYADSGSKSTYHTETGRKILHPFDAPLQDPQEAITTYSEPELRHFTKLGRTVQRTLLQRTKSHPYSPFSSFSDDITTTLKRVPTWYGKDARCITIIKAHTDGMVNALLRINGQPDIHVYISEDVKPTNGSSITWTDFINMQSSPELWLSMCQLKADRPFGDWWHRTSYQPDEWLICRAFPKSRVLETWPCTGTTIVQINGSESELVTEHLRGVLYYWNFGAASWQKLQGKKRKLTQSESSDEDSVVTRSRDAEQKNGNNGEAVLHQQVHKKVRYSGDKLDPLRMTDPKTNAQWSNSKERYAEPEESNVCRVWGTSEAGIPQDSREESAGQVGIEYITNREEKSEEKSEEGHKEEK